MDVLTQVYADHAIWVWLALGMAILAVEVSTGTGWLMWPAASAGVVGLLSGVLNPAALEIAVFAGLTVISTLLARRFWPQRGGESADINDNVARLVGHRGKAAAAFAGGAGRVLIDGKEWAAELDEGDSLKAGDDVEVIGLSGGTRLRVRAAR
ncbi:NfeD family protein [Phenylobacterium sp.]|uniref:NfeD family protein n=1 Tax=Phenylobacterium sp. TaxID=1871053 RepID=UPI002734139D|nr:NfeD family protein [Phenylobacterium sp.]MDP3855220.1 NfeD family protein [Phenylobacterium sp.]